MVGLSTNNYGPAQYIVDADQANGTHTTISAALTAASSGETIFVRPGTYTEDLTLKAGVNLTTFCLFNNVSLPTVIVGKMSASFSGVCNISGFEFQTNSDFILEVTGSSDTAVRFQSCFFNCTNNTGISFTNSNSSSRIRIYFCYADVATTGITFLNSSSAGGVRLFYSNIQNTGSTTTASNISAGILTMRYCYHRIPFSATSNGSFQLWHSTIDTGIENVTAVALNTPGVDHLINTSELGSGTAIPLTITSAGSASTLTFRATVLTTTNATQYTVGGTAVMNIFGTTNTAVSFAGDSGSEVPTNAGVITISGGNGITTSAASNAVSVALDAPVDESDGGTGQTTYSTGDVLYASASNTLSKLAAGSDGQVLTLASGVPSWAASGGGGLDTATKMRIYDDFTSAYTTGSAIYSTETWFFTRWDDFFSSSVIDGDHPGTVCNATTSSGQGAGFFLSASAGRSIEIGSGELTFVCVFYLTNLSTGSNRYLIRIGFSDESAALNAASTVSDGFYVSYVDNVNSGNWVGNSASGGTTSTVNSSVAGATGWNYCKIVVNAAASSISYSVNGTSLGSAITTNIPTSTLLAPWFNFGCSAGSITQRTIFTDLILVEKDLTNARWT